MTNSSIIINAMNIFFSFVWGIIYFPFWWYVEGFWLVLLEIKAFIANRAKMLDIAVWLKNVFTPMYGQTDFAGRLISFFMRLFQIFFRGLVMIFWLIFSLLLIAFWLLLPLVIVYRVFVL